MSTAAVAKPSSAPSALPVLPEPVYPSVLLSSVEWATYLQLRDQPANCHVRMTYDCGRLELMSPVSRRHERVHRLLSRMVDAWTEERNIPMSSGGSTTLRREDLGRGTEPDSSFHLATETAVRAVDDLVLPESPPPDLVIEADFASSSIPRLPIYAALGVPEVWQWHRDTLRLRCLVAGDYQDATASRVLPGFPVGVAVELLTARHTLDETTLLRRFRQQVRQLPTAGETA